VNTRRSSFPVKNENQLLFITDIYWKEATTAFKKHQTSDCHREAVEALLVLPQCTKDIAESQDAEHVAQKVFNRHVFMIVLNNLMFLVHQGLALRGDGDEINSNFVQLLHLHGCIFFVMLAKKLLQPVVFCDG